MEVVRAAPDGYTLLFSSNSALSSNVALQKGLPYDPRRDFSPIAGVGVTTLVLMVRADYPARDVRELIAHARRNPGRVSAGYGSSASQVAIAMLNKAAALDVLAVPYKSIPLAVTDVIGGVADFVFVDLGNAIAQARGGRLRALAVASEKRSELTPQWPPLSEVLPGFDIVAWVGIAGPAGMPPPVVEAPSRATRRLLGAPETREKLATLGFDPMPMDPPELGRFIHAETAKWIQLARDANIQPQ